ncbi:MAG: TraR/DksA family transcriptional regulator [Gammaproteobacteria bacterium]
MDEKFHELAADLAQWRRDQALQRIRESVAAPEGPWREDCQDCGDPIPAARRTAMPGALRCISCQTIFEGGSR